MVTQFKVAVIMPCKADSTRYVEQAVDSILKQSYRDFEFVIVDDHSSCEVATYFKQLKDSRVRLFRHENGSKGISFCMNYAIKWVEADIVFRMDADDIAHPDRLKLQLQEFYKSPEVAVCGSNMRYFCEDRGKVRKGKIPTSHEAIAYQLCWSNAINQPTVACRKTAIVDVGGYEEMTACAGDLELWSRMVLRYPIKNLPNFLLDYRVHGKQISTRLASVKQSVRDRVYFRYRYELTGIEVPLLFDHLSTWSQHCCPSLDQWQQWIDCLKILQRIFTKEGKGLIKPGHVDPSRDLARRLFRSIKAANKAHAPIPQTAYQLLSELAPIYAWGKKICGHLPGRSFSF